jgi:DNA-binding response OmpR family regulator
MPCILIVDDSATMRTHLSRIFAHAGFTTEGAPDGFAALDLLRDRSDIDAVVLDVHMPRMGGLEMVEALRKAQLRPDLPILILSAEAGESLVARARALGVRHWFVKPFQPEALVAAVRALLPA